MREYDYIIVGGGAAGCVLARRLTEDRDVRVLVVEAGGRDSSPLIHLPLAVGKVWNNPRFNWNYISQPEPYADGRRLNFPRGKVLGGSSSINMMSYGRGHHRDFDRWEQMGATGWSFASLLPYFRASESYEGSAPHRGRGGPIRVTKSVSPDPIYRAFLEAGQEVGYPLQQDHNEPEPHGFSMSQFMVGSGRRSSGAVAYLAPALSRPNLEVRVACLATRIVIERGRAVGVVLSRDGATEQVRASREVILCTGAYGSPQLLLLSGIGAAESLKAHGIQPVLDLPGVGENLSDHPQVNLLFSLRGSSYMRRQLRADRLAVSLLRNGLFGTGFASEPPAGATAFIRSGADEPHPDIQLFCLPYSPKARPWLKPFVAPAEEQMVLKAMLLRPKSRGRVWLSSANPAEQPNIVANFLKEKADRIALREAVRFCRDLAKTTALGPVVDGELSPSRGVVGDAEIDGFVRATVETIFHPCGTCRMGQDRMAVVDPELRVRGLSGLRVVDASVMPDHVGATINAAVVAVAERAADLIRGKAPRRGRQGRMSPSKASSRQ